MLLMIHENYVVPCRTGVLKMLYMLYGDATAEL